MAEARQITQLKKLAARRNKFMQRVQKLDKQIDDILGQIKVKGAVEKEDCPKEGTGPYKLCKVMSSRPKTKEQIAKKTGLSVGTVMFYLHKYNCFQLAGRGKGYIYKKPK